MFTFAPRVVAAFALAGLAWAVTSPAVALGDRPWSARAAVQEPLSPETVIKKHITGKATVEFSAGEVYLMPASWAATSDAGWKAVPLQILPKDIGKKGSFYNMSVVVSGEVTTRLKQLGIENPAEHFRGKLLRVSGTITRFETRARTIYRMEVNNLDQIEIIRKQTS
jgi:hypothetical protein